MAARKTNGLTAEDRILWGKVARTAEPLHGRDAMDRLCEDMAQAISEIQPAPLPPVEKGIQISPLRPQAPRGDVPGFDRPTRRKLEKGRLPIEARIDLHGLFQAEAHAMLHGFLARAHARGMRHVLVITGKGSSIGSEGVLNRALPGWLSTPLFRGMVSGHETAARRHGGEGAFYVRLRRNPERAP
ncbi:MAG: Smr/MutS family protein [Notoacmeibacter sp.]|nr:Smr/MutS family protein [Notoacmeibacter sp.]MCC0033528.1 Smr/MutS family protein [Brucellaceae bacterium]